jgi:hypothetical protein
MKRVPLVLAASLLAVVILAGQAQAVPITHNVAVAANEVKTWEGTAAVGLNANYNGAIEEDTARTCTDDIETKCEYALVALTNPVPEEDADGRLNKSVIITLNNFRPLDSPFTDFALAVYTTDETGSFRGDEVAFSDNSDLPDPDEQVGFSVTTTTTTPTVYYLVEVAYFYVLNSQYTGTVDF